jgi:O-antigen/teichoic acid export membrane protein
MIVGLYTSRIVLHALGVEDYGIYNVIGGVVAMFSLISGALSGSVSRFVTFALGEGNTEKLKKVFSTSLSVHFGLAFIVLIGAETIGLWFLNNKINIPIERMEAANWVFQCSIISFLTGIIIIPYNATVIAHERMGFFARISILEVILKLITALLLYCSSFDRLPLYAALLSSTGCITLTIYILYCKHTFIECTYTFIIDKLLLKKMMSFSTWSFIGTSASLLKDQGVNIAINIFCGAAVNAARGISLQINNAIGYFAWNFMTAVTPQVTKSYAAGDYQYTRYLIERGSRFAFFLLLILSLPILYETEMILKLWLADVPTHTVFFTRLVLILLLLESQSYTLNTAILATGDIKLYQIIVSGIELLNFPIAYIFLKNGFFPEVTVIITIASTPLIQFLRLYFLRRAIKLSIRSYLKDVIWVMMKVTLLSAILPCIIIYTQPTDSLARLLIVCVVSALCSASAIYYIGCSKGERVFLIEFCKSRLRLQ